jgi:hypothetical protein
MLMRLTCARGLADPGQRQAGMGRVASGSGQIGLAEPKGET